MSDSAPSNSTEDRFAWYAVLALPFVVPVVVGIVPFASSGAFTENPFVYPKILALALLVAIASASWAIGVVRERIQVRSVPGGWWLVGFLGLADPVYRVRNEPERGVLRGQVPTRRSYGRAAGGRGVLAHRAVADHSRTHARARLVDGRGRCSCCSGHHPCSHAASIRSTCREPIRSSSFEDHRCWGTPTSPGHTLSCQLC